MSLPKSGEKLMGLEMARGVAACLVVFYHLARHIAQDTGAAPFGSLTQFGHAGVDFFFVVSGFIILHVHWGDIGRPDRAGRYFMRRVTRIYPIYWVVLLISLVFLSIRGLPWPDEIGLLRDILLLPFGTTTVGVAWTLQFEMVFYAVFLVLVLAKLPGLSLLGIWLGFIVVAHLSPSVLPENLPMILVSGYSAQFFMGMGAAYWLRHGMPVRPFVLLASGFAGFVAAAACENLGFLNGYAAPARLFYGVPAAVFLMGIVSAERGGQIHVPRMAAAFGQASYAIYLTHLLVIGVAWKLLGFAGLGPDRLAPWISFLMIGIGAIAAGLVFARFVEQPLIGRVRDLLAKRPVAARPASGSVA